MSTELKQQWQDRVFEIEQEMQCVRDEIAAVEAQTQAVSQQTRKYQEMVKRDGTTMQKKLQELEQEIEDAQKRYDEGKAQQVEVERQHQEAAQHYDEMSKFVKTLKQQEHVIEHREDYEKMLSEESTAWRAEEEQLRRVLKQTEAELKGQRQEHKQSIEALEKQLKDAENSLHSNRMSREPTEGLGVSSRQSSLAKPGSRKRELLGDVSNK